MKKKKASKKQIDATNDPSKDEDDSHPRLEDVAISKKGKVKRKLGEDLPHSEPERKKKKKNLKAEAASNAPTPPKGEPEMKLKKKKKKNTNIQADVALDGPSRSEGEETHTKKRKSKKTDGTSFTRTEKVSPPLKKKKKRKVDKESEDAEQDKSDASDDSFFAGKDDAKHEVSGSTKKVPDHLHPFKVFVGNLPYTAKENTVRSKFAACGAIERFDMPLNNEGRASGNAFIYYTADDAVVKALELEGVDFEGRPLKVRRAERQNKGAKGKGKDDKGKGKGKDDKGKGKDKPRNDQTTIFLGGLAYDIDSDTIKRDFEECGEIEAVRMVKNSEGGFKGVAFVVFKDENGVKEALKYDGDQYSGRTLTVRRAGENGKGKGGKGKNGKGQA